MKLDFKVYKLEGNEHDDFIIVGEESLNETPYFRAHKLDDAGLKVIGGLNLIDTALYIEKSKLSVSKDNLGYEIVELNIPGEYLTIDIIENIQKLNG